MENPFAYFAGKEKRPAVKIYMDSEAVMTDLAYWSEPGKSGRFGVGGQGKGHVHGSMGKLTKDEHLYCWLCPQEGTHME